MKKTNFYGINYRQTGKDFIRPPLKNLSRCLRTHEGGGNLEPKIMENCPIAFDEQNNYLRKDGTVGTLTTDGSSPKHNNRIVEHNYKMRKLTEKECFRLMGVTDKQFETIKKNQSKTSLYHLAGDSIVVAVLVAILGQCVQDFDFDKYLNNFYEQIKEQK